MIALPSLQFDNDFFESIKNENIDELMRQRLAFLSEEKLQEFVASLVAYAEGQSGRNSDVTVQILNDHFSEALDAADLDIASVTEEERQFHTGTVVGAIAGSGISSHTRAQIAAHLPVQIPMQKPTILAKYINFYSGLHAENALSKPELDKILAAGKPQQKDAPLAPQVAIARMKQCLIKIAPQLVNKQNEFIQSLNRDSEMGL